jgi:hypothetical protein
VVLIQQYHYDIYHINPLNAELNPICHLLALVGARPIFHVSRIRVKRQINTKYNIYFTSEYTPLAACCSGHAGSMQRCLQLLDV